MNRISFKDLLQEALLVEVSIEQLRKQFVEAGKLSPETFERIVDVSNGKSAYATWMAKKVEEKIIKEEDIYKYEEFFKVFEKNKGEYPKKDINQIKNAKDVSDFQKKSIEIMDRELKNKEQGVGEKDHLSTLQIKSLKESGIDLLGTVSGYQVFKVPQSAKGNEEAYTKYKNLLGRCSGGTINICTIADQNYFDRYLSSDNLYVFYKHSDPQSPYQFHYKESQFMDREDNNLIPIEDYLEGL